MSEIVATCLWRLNADVVLALDDRFGEPDDAYVNGSQVWIRDDGPGGATLEWRLHPAPGFARPAGVGTHELFEATAFALRSGDPLPAPLDALWEGLEAFPCYGDEVEPAPLAAACTDTLGLAPDAYGVVDHDKVADEWERREGKSSILDGLLRQLGS